MKGDDGRGRDVRIYLLGWNLVEQEQFSLNKHSKRTMTCFPRKFPFFCELYISKKWQLSKHSNLYIRIKHCKHITCLWILFLTSKNLSNYICFKKKDQECTYYIDPLFPGKSNLYQCFHSKAFYNLGNHNSHQNSDTKSTKSEITSTALLLFH